jgi:hypothetical protein
MIVSHRYGYIFVKTRKTAGTSLEIALSRHAGDSDVITPITPEDEQLRQREGGVGPQNYTLSRRWALRDATAALRQGQPRSAAYRVLHGSRLRNHTPASLIRQVVGNGIWEQYTTFAVERNPWDRAVSSYYWETKDDDPPPSFAEFLKRTSDETLSCRSRYAIDGVVAVDAVLQYERLQTDLPDLWTALGLPGEPRLPRAKGAFRPRGSRDFRSMFSDADAERIARVCRAEIAEQGYTFDQRLAGVADG